MKYLFPGLTARDTDILFHQRSDFINTSPSLPVAYDVTVTPPFQEISLCITACEAREVASAAEQGKNRKSVSKLAAIPGEDLPGRSILGWKFVPISFSLARFTLCNYLKVLDEYPAAVATLNGCSKGVVRSRLH